MRRTRVTGSCAVIALLAVSCRPSAPHVNDLKPDPVVAAVIASQRAHQEAYEAAKRMTDADAAREEARLAREPEDQGTREALLNFYMPGAMRRPGSEAHRTAYRTHVLWLVTHHPDGDLAGRNFLSSAVDPDGAAEARKLWLPLVEKPDAPAAVLGNAGKFFIGSDRVLAEQLLERARAIDPNGPAGSSSPVRNFMPRPWTVTLAQLYTETLAREDSAARPPAGAAGLPRPTAASVKELDATEVRRKLDVTTDESLLTNVAGYLMVSYGARDPGLRQAGVHYAERVVQLNPKAAQARQLLAQRRMMESGARTPLAKLYALRKATRDENLYGAISKLPEADRFQMLPEIAESDYMGAEAIDFTRNGAPDAIAKWKRSKAFAQDLLALLPTFKNDPQYGNAFYRVNVSLGLHAMREGDGRAAAAYLLEAAKAPATEEMSYGSTVSHLESRLINTMLKYGDLDVVATFYERTALLYDGRKDDRLAAAAAIRKGVMPESYQWALAQGQI